MRIVNKLTKPGDIRRVDLTPDTVRVYTSDGQDRVYRLVPVTGLEYSATATIATASAKEVSEDDKLLS